MVAAVAERVRSRQLRDTVVEKERREDEQSTHCAIKKAGIATPHVPNDRLGVSCTKEPVVIEKSCQQGHNPGQQHYCL